MSSINNYYKNIYNNISCDTMIKVFNDHIFIINDDILNILLIENGELINLKNNI